MPVTFQLEKSQIDRETPPVSDYNTIQHKKIKQTKSVNILQIATERIKLEHNTLIPIKVTKSVHN